MESSSVNLSAEFARVKQLRERRDRKQMWRSIIAFLAGNSEPKIDRISGKNWRVFDPVNGQSLHFSTEQEVRVWLDERHSL